MSGPGYEKCDPISRPMMVRFAKNLLTFEVFTTFGLIWTHFDR